MRAGACSAELTIRSQIAEHGHMTLYEILSDGIATLEAATDADRDDDNTRVHGVVIGDGDVTRGLSGKRTRWPGDVLEDMAGMLEGKPITMADSLDPEQHVGVTVTEDGPQLTGAVSLDEKVGEITDDAYEPGVGLLFDGFVADWEAEDAVERSLAQVSPVVVRDLELVEGDPNDEDALYEVTEVAAVRDLALVADGGVPSNEINVGASPDIGAEMAEALSSHFGADVDSEALSGPADEAGVSGGDGDDSDPVGDDGPNDEAASGGEGQSTPGDSDTRSIMDELTDKERELVAAARQTDDPRVVEADVPDRLTELEAQLEEHEAVIDAAAGVEDPEVMPADEAEAMQESLGEFRNFFKETLAEQKGVAPEMLKDDEEALTAPFRDDEDGELDVEALTQSPESGGGPSPEDSDGLELDDGELEEVEAMQNRIEYWDGKNEAIVEAERETLVEALGVEDYDDAEAKLEVL